MKHAINKSLLEKIIKQRNGYLVLASGLVILTLAMLLIIAQLINKQSTIIVPPTINKSFWVTKNSASSEYLAEMSSFFTELRLNVTPHSIAKQHEMLLRYVAPQYYGKLKTRLISEAERIKKSNISTVFYPVDIQVNQNNLKVTIIGDLKSFIGQTTLPNHRKAYLITYNFHHGHLYVTNFKEVKHVKNFL